MEGLIPLVYKTVQKTRSRRRYKCLSSGAAQSYDISDFYKPVPLPPPPHHHPRQELGDGHLHRRHNSVDGDYSSSSAVLPGITDPSPPSSSEKKQQLVRFRSHKMFSCVTGAFS